MSKSLVVQGVWQSWGLNPNHLGPSAALCRDLASLTLSGGWGADPQVGPDEVKQTGA